VNKPKLCSGALSIVLVLLLSGCGGVKSTANGGTATLPTSGSPPSTGGTVSSPIIVQVGSGSTVAGISISVPAPAASTPPNAQVLGVFAGSSGSASASNTGDLIHLGQTATVLLFGPGLDGSMQVTIGGPDDIQITNVHGINSTNGLPGVAFTATVNGNAALGARTVFLKNAQSDITAFAGGLEVVQ
jgi:hypothetical protein